MENRLRKLELMPLKRLGLSLETSFISIYKPLLNFALLFKLLADAAQKLECCITFFSP